MNRFLPYITGTLGVLVLILGFMTYSLVGSKAKLADQLADSEQALKTASIERDVAQATLASNAKNKAAIARSGALARASLSAAAASAPDWANQPVPAGVLEVLNAE